MQPLLILAVTFGLLWVLFLLPQQRRVRAHQQLVASLEEDDEIVLTAGIFGRITTIGPEEMTVEVAPSVELRVARMAVLRRVEHAVAGFDEPGPELPEETED
ncbi:MAG TPA: preprotein translocase subunit YajC [Acidimicrobiales bacterium]|nr:preprotein translocase subunit YajC [Acidimicrobiales bacterium]